VTHELFEILAISTSSIISQEARSRVRPLDRLSMKTSVGFPDPGPAWCKFATSDKKYHCIVAFDYTRMLRGGRMARIADSLTIQVEMP
jgi:hypothetical protein